MKKNKCLIRFFGVRAALVVAVHGLVFAMQIPVALQHVAPQEVAEQEISLKPPVAFQLSNNTTVMLERPVVDHFPPLARMFELDMREGLSGVAQLKNLENEPCSDNVTTTFATLLERVVQVAVPAHAAVPGVDARELYYCIRNRHLSLKELSDLSSLVDRYGIKELYKPVAKCVVQEMPSHIIFFKHNPDKYLETLVKKFGLELAQECMHVLVTEKLMLHKNNCVTKLATFDGNLCHQSPELIVTRKRTANGPRVQLWRSDEHVFSFSSSPQQSVEGDFEFLSNDNHTLVVSNSRRLQLWRYNVATNTFIYDQNLKLPENDLRELGFTQANIVHASPDAQDLVLTNGNGTVFLHKNGDYYGVAHTLEGTFQEMSNDMRTVILRNDYFENHHQVAHNVDCSGGTHATLVAKLNDQTHQYEIFASLQGTFCKVNAALDRVITHVFSEEKDRMEVRVSQLAPQARQNAPIVFQVPGDFVAASDDLRSIMVKRDLAEPGRCSIFEYDEQGNGRGQNLSVPGSILSVSGDMNTLLISDAPCDAQFSLHKREIPLGELTGEQIVELCMIQQEGGQMLDYANLPETGRQRHREIFAGLNPEIKRFLLNRYVKNS